MMKTGQLDSTVSFRSLWPTRRTDRQTTIWQNATH